MLTTRVEYVQQPTAVTILRLAGELDGANYLTLISQVKTLYDQDTRRLLLDLSELKFMASSGLVALHAITTILHGAPPPDPDAGWSAFHAIAHDRENRTAPEELCKLLRPQPRVQKTLETTGFDQILAIYQDESEALATF
jgi:anti-anti-sigma regulatory factor